jgi:hypothetical protein
MATLSIHIPDDMAERLKTIAHLRGMSFNKLMFEQSTQVLGKKMPTPLWLVFEPSRKL